MKRVGIFLDAEPGHGGTFQYGRSLLAAVAALPRDEFRTVAAYTAEGWREHVEGVVDETLYVPRGLLDRTTGGIWERLRLPVSLWRRIAPHIHGFTRSVVRARCDLWLFPSQDTWSFRLPVPALGTIHDLMHRYERRFPEVSADGQYRLRERKYREMCRWCAGVLVDSEVGREHVRESYGVAPERIFPLPFVPPEYVAAERDDGPRDGRGDARSTLVESLPRRFLFYPAQFWEHKNHKALVRALADLRDEHPDMALVFSGTPKNGYRSCRELVSSLELDDRVVFLGYVPDEAMPELYARARALVMPTYFGPTNIPPLEAFVSGCAVAVSDIYGMREQLGDAALFFHPDSSREIREALSRLWTDDALCHELVERGYRKAEEWQQKDFDRRALDIVRQVTCSTPVLSP